MSKLESLYSEFIHLSRYSRWVPDKKRRETWDETVSRYFDFFEEHLLERCNYKVPKKLRDELEGAVLNLEVMPSMRALMTAGPALKRDEMAGYNCLSGETLVTTKELGIVPIEECEGKELHIVDGNGEWVKSKCNKFGRQKIKEIHFATSGKGSFMIRATGNHRWVEKTGNWKTTDELNIGDRLKNVSFPDRNYIDVNSKDYHDGIIHGIIYGDGTAQYRHSSGKDEKGVYIKKTCKGFVIRLCGKSKELIEYFDGYSVSYPKSFCGDPVVYLFHDSAIDLKELPDVSVDFFTEEYLTGFIRGWLAADGSVSRSGQISLAACEIGKTWIYKHGPKLGFVVSSSMKYPNKTNYGKRKSDLYRIRFDRRWFHIEDLLLTYKKERFRPIDITRSPGFGKIIDIVDINIEKEVFCFTVPTTNSFLLTNNLLTGNCSYLAVDDIRAFDEILYILMLGCGVGFSVERQFVNELPTVAEEMHNTETTIVVADSKIGWAKALKELISMLYVGQIPKWDLSKIRPSGAPLKTFGGRASGPEPLNSLFEFVVRIFRSAMGRKLTSIECHDIVCKIGEVVVVGGVRRSATISLSNLSDDRMRAAKSGQWWIDNPQRALANNSACYTEVPDIGIFMDEWKSLYDSKSGERGIFNRQAAKRYAEATGRRDPAHEFGTNPCGEILLRSKQNCVSGNTPLITDSGIYLIENLVGNKVKVWNGKEFSEIIVRKTGENQKLFRVWLSDGSYLDCTEDHKFSVKTRFQKEWSKVSVKDLDSFSKYTLQVQPTLIKNNDSNKKTMEEPYTCGFAVGDGYVYKDKVGIDLFGDKDIDCPVNGTRHKPYEYKEGLWKVRVMTKCCPDMIKSMKLSSGAILSLAEYKRSDVLEFIAGLADADGSITKSGGMRIYLSGEERARALQLVLKTNGINSSVCLLHRKGRRTNLAARKKDLWYLQITDCSDLPCKRLDTSNGHKPRFKGKYQNIRKIEELPGLHDTFCFKEHITGMAVFGNVLTYQCNLTEVIVRSDDTEETLANKVRLATILGTWQSTLDKYRYVTKKWEHNNKEERLLGVSMTGIYDNKFMSTPSKELCNALDKLKEIAIETNKDHATKLGIEISASITCTKPSGTVSQLVNSASGIHPRHSEYYIRTVRADNKDPLCQFMKEAGFPYEPCVMNPGHVSVFSFPVKSPSKIKYRSDITAIDHLNLWLVYKKHWAEHTISITVTVKEHEWLKVAAFVYEHFKDITGISFLPHSDHCYQQAPFQECNKDDYEALLSKMPQNVTWVGLHKYEENDNTKGSQQMACTGGVCEIADLL